MTITFYSNLSDERKINKNISQVGDPMIGTLKDRCDFINPTIVIENVGMINANYCYIADFDRYYFINNQIILSGNHVQLNLSVDVLMSFKNIIMTLPVIIDMSSYNNNDYLSNDVYKATVKTKTDVIQFPSGLNDDGEYILITAGG